MKRRECFGSIQQVVFRGDLTMTQTRLECRECEEIRDCLSYVKERDELRKQNMIAQIIDLSRIISNEIGSCLLEVLSRMYSSPLGMTLFKSLLLFYEVPRATLSFGLTIPISSSLIKLIEGEETERGHSAREGRGSPQRPSKNGFMLRIVLIQRSFPGNRKANMGLIAHEVARVLSTDDDGLNQILGVLGEREGEGFKLMDPHQRTKWLMEMWGLREEWEAFQTKATALEPKK